jgi:hypothetical protein
MVAPVRAGARCSCRRRSRSRSRSPSSHLDGRAGAALGLKAPTATRRPAGGVPGHHRIVIGVLKYLTRFVALRPSSAAWPIQGRQVCSISRPSASSMQALRSSPGWTRTNNPPVNSRMLCQLSYRGLAGGL